MSAADFIIVELFSDETLVVRLDNAEGQDHPAVEIFVRSGETTRHPTAAEWNLHKDQVIEVLDRIYL